MDISLYGVGISRSNAIHFASSGLVFVTRAAADEYVKTLNAERLSEHSTKVEVWEIAAALS